MNSKAKILVVDDTPANLALVLDALSGAGYEVLVAESGRGALALLEHNLPDLILLDVVMLGWTASPPVRASRPCPSAATCPCSS